MGERLSTTTKSLSSSVPSTHRPFANQGWPWPMVPCFRTSAVITPLSSAPKAATGLNGCLVKRHSSPPQRFKVWDSNTMCEVWPSLVWIVPTSVHLPTLWHRLRVFSFEQWDRKYSDDDCACVWNIHYCALHSQHWEKICSGLLNALGSERVDVWTAGRSILGWFGYAKQSQCVRQNKQRAEDKSQSCEEHGLEGTHWNVAVAPSQSSIELRERGGRKQTHCLCIISCPLCTITTMYETY